MDTLLLIVHILVCFFLVVIVLLQQGKGADIGATFGGSSQSLFGTEGPMPLLNKITTAAAITFMVTSLSLAYISSQDSHATVMSGVTTEKMKDSAPVVEKKVAEPASNAVKSSDAIQEAAPAVESKVEKTEPVKAEPVAEKKSDAAAKNE
ncbi:preprotein translocase subunit SecG [Desulforhopalus vacuolatus]|uniref:preprotein translocase subunit SecG n=1 Tax=Desulforhopalus vacuolatus TaxID=40414 RepID=UPI001966B0C4|nr:preprotein translocase subunit SecG [Desulforhopalus vacuolatus]MBM9518391.1 preprotein translocase subunit SecG [Desulforhopalus vacuolatus]